jgi:predicted NAD/FAD-dependent oxidoreductase
LNDAVFDRVIIATPAWDAAALLKPFNDRWSHTAAQMKHEAISTVYVQAPTNFRLPQAMLALSTDPEAPAQFVFDRGQICTAAQTPGLLAFVVSAVKLEKTHLEGQVIQQALDICQSISHEKVDLKIVQTVVEKRATFACTPQLKRPNANPCDGLVVCGDYVEGPYPATLEGAVMSGLQAAEWVSG